MKMSPGFAGAASVAFLEVQRQIKAIVKDSRGDKSRYASLTLVVDSVRPILNAHGFSIVQGVVDSGSPSVVGVETTLLHGSGEWISTMVRLPLAGARKSKADVKADGGSAFHEADAQAGGSTITYGRRYGLAAILCLVTDEDDDGASAGVRAAREEATVGQTGAVLDPRLMPIGDRKGKPISEIEASVLNRALAHCRANGMTAEGRIISTELTNRSLAGRSAERALANAGAVATNGNTNGNGKAPAQVAG